MFSQQFDCAGGTMRKQLYLGFALLLSGCGKSGVPPVEYRDLAMRDANHRFFERGILKHGMWNVSIKIDQLSIGSLPDDSPSVKGIIQLIGEKVVQQPMREVNVCLSQANSDIADIFGMGDTCRYTKLAFAGETGTAEMTCGKSKLMDATTATTTYQFNDNGFAQQTAMIGVTDFGGMGKARPKRSSMTGTWLYKGPCQQGASPPK
jgi:Protein of unknown function (DUF3617)